METATSAIASEEALKPRLPLNELRVFAEAFNRISSAYVEEIDDKTLLEYAIIGMLSQLDPHSAYLDKDSFDELQESTTGNYGGLGLEIGMEDGFVKVISPMDDTPADKAGIESGDLIVQLDGTPVKGMNLSEAIEVMRGEPGSTITVTVVKEGASGPTELTLTREVIKVASVRQRYLEDGYGYLRVAQFQAGTGDEVDKAIIRLKDAGDLDGLIIDLRNNPGGVLQAAVDVSNAFMDEGLIVYTQGRVDDAEIRYSANTPDSVNGIPIVVLVNEGSASASEIVAGALQDHGRAIIMGTDTFGKGSVQTILPLSKEKAIKLTTARYYTPNGKSIQAEGITPDIWVDRSTVTPVKRGPWRFKEKDLSKHLENDDVADADKAEEQAEQTDRQNRIELASRDYQLNEALTLLKGLHILNGRTRPQG
ncbi:MAG: S41 family peptidase [Pseudomonadales bacterium]|nr:S41 family peptidase [Pseudomonadales bacterium]MBO6565965.1 S41 family peptidase [Pseudomonadales bacterium]MBO6597768.1 S41 family peptidase [Pseudomonadales bacterium]MBO6655946.1 S41 family peptidase [Pseudomonadales bacterium]MBO6704083.1 S41 family peptidase [Pseudomonadales bacterium]